MHQYILFDFITGSLYILHAAFHVREHCVSRAIPMRILTFLRIGIIGDNGVSLLVEEIGGNGRSAAVPMMI